jgi:hypothetical protein
VDPTRNRFHLGQFRHPLIVEDAEPGYSGRRKAA